MFVQSKGCSTCGKVDCNIVPITVAGTDYGFNQCVECFTKKILPLDYFREQYKDDTKAITVSSDAESFEATLKFMKLTHEDYRVYVRLHGLNDFYCNIFNFFQGAMVKVASPFTSSNINYGLVNDKQIIFKNIATFILGFDTVFEDKELLIEGATQHGFPNQINDQLSFYDACMRVVYKTIAIDPEFYIWLCQEHDTIRNDWGHIKMFFVHEAFEMLLLTLFCEYTLTKEAEEKALVAEMENTTLDEVE